ncbi:MAG: type II toxin-antitoxin system Phd/YefM family antitoxin [Anaerolineales bacterium]|nr:MAG: type II toxin-antitoxin system Phd/YefM family antitoxin [Anaerolineales bacterium]
MVNKIATVTDLRANLAQFLEELESGPLMVIQRSRPAGYLVSVEEFEALIQRLEDLEDLIEGMETVREYLEDPDVVVDAEEVFGKLGI